MLDNIVSSMTNADQQLEKPLRSQVKKKKKDDWKIGLNSNFYMRVYDFF